MAQRGSLDVLWHLASLADGAIKVASTYSIGAGKTVAGLVSKDATAPSAPRANVASGAYTATQNVVLSSNDGTIHYIGRWPDPSGVAA